MRKKLFIVLIIFFAAQLLFRIYNYRSVYLTPFSASYWQYRYLHSQWVVPNSQDSIGDDGLYTYAGWRYIHGSDPTLLNAELPPFGKYMIGLSEVIFRNQNIFSLFSGLFVLGAFYLLNRFLFKDALLAFIPVVFFSCEPLFYTQLRTPLLDNLYLGLFFMVLYFFLRKQYIMSAIFFGLMAATKSAVTTFAVIIFVMLIYLFLTKQKDVFKKYVFSLFVAAGVFLLTYIVYFLHGHSLRAFLGVQKYIIVFYEKGAKGSLITPWEMILTGKWHTWWGVSLPVEGWHIGWVLLFIFTLYALYLMIKKRYTRPFLLIAIWIPVYLAFLSLIPTWPRYLLLALPFMYNLSIWTIITVMHSKYKVLRTKEAF